MKKGLMLIIVLFLNIFLIGIVSAEKILYPNDYDIRYRNFFEYNTLGNEEEYKPSYWSGKRGFEEFLGIINYTLIRCVNWSDYSKSYPCELEDIKFEVKENIELKVWSLSFAHYLWNENQYAHTFGAIGLVIDGKEYWSMDGVNIGHIFVLKGNITYRSWTMFDVLLVAEDNSSFIGRLDFYFDDLNDDEGVYISGNFIENYKPRIYALEAWKQTIDLTVQTIENQLESVKQWLFFWNYQGEEENVCNAIENECGGTIPCINECGEGNVGCIDKNTRWYCELQTDGCNDKIEVSCGDSFECDDGECVPLQQEVIFRTNAVNGDYKSGTWLAVDTNNNCGLEGYDYSGSSGILSSCKGTLLVNSPEGYGVYLYNGKVYVCVPLGTKFVYKKYYSSSTTAVTSSSQTEPYASNNQEVYGECTPS